MSNCIPCSQTQNCGTPDPCIPCEITLDFKCIFYNTLGTDVTCLDGLNLANGSSLKLFAETVDEKIKQLNVINFSLTNLRQDYVINTLQQFSEAVDTQLGILETTVNGITGLSNLALTANDSSSINFTTSGTLNHTLTGSVIISAAAHNQASIVSDGVFVSPQTLSVNYDAKTISISDGNSIDISSLMASPSGYLGNVTSTPSYAINGNYWYNTSTGKLMIKVNNIVKEIVTV